MSNHSSEIKFTMDSNYNQSAKRNFEAHSFQNQDDDNGPSPNEEEGTSTKRFSKELDPLNMGYILEKIFSFLDAGSIKSARQVNPLWSIEGAKMLMTKCYLKIPSVQYKSSSNKEIDEFKAFLSLKSSDHSMISSITIDKVGDEKLWKSLGVLGPQIKSIKLNNFNEAVEMLSKILRILPNLKFLSFKDLGYNPLIIKAFISLSNANKIRNPLVISFMTLEPENVEQLEDIGKFVNCKNIFLTELEYNLPGFNFFNPQLGSRIVSIMTRLLIKNQNVLKSLNFNQGPYKTKVIKILSPVMSTTEINRVVIPFMALEADDPDQLQYIEAFANCENIMIEKLKFGLFSFANDIPNYKARVLNILKTILTTNQNTIKILSFEDEYCKPEFIKVLTSLMSTAERNQNPLVLPRLDLGNGDQLDDIEKFADCSNIVIEELDVILGYRLFCGVPDPRIRIYNLMVKLLSTSKNALKKLTLINFELYLSLLKFPRLNSLTHLNLALLSSTLVQCKFSPSFRFSENLPNLSHVTIHECKEQLPDFFAHLFEQTGTAPSVKSLKYRNFFSNLDLEPLLKTFPNLEEFETSDAACSEKMFQALWKHGANLKRLKFDIDLDNLAINVADLDSMFTGFTPETVKKIKETLNLDPYTLEELEKLRVSPSILNLKDLEHLTIQFHGWSENQTLLSCRMLAVASKYAFCLLPKDPRIVIDQL